MSYLLIFLAAFFGIGMLSSPRRDYYYRPDGDRREVILDDIDVGGGCCCDGD
jgi:hypothetical protein